MQSVAVFGEDILEPVITTGVGINISFIAM